MEDNRINESEINTKGRQLVSKETGYFIIFWLGSFIIVIIMILLILIYVFKKSTFKSNLEQLPCNSFQYCDCPIDINDDCHDSEIISDKDHRRYCRKIIHSSEPCTCIPYDYTSISGKYVPISSYININK